MTGLAVSAVGFNRYNTNNMPFGASPPQTYRYARPAQAEPEKKGMPTWSKVVLGVAGFGALCLVAGHLGGKLVKASKEIVTQAQQPDKNKYLDVNLRAKFENYSQNTNIPTVDDLAGMKELKAALQKVVRSVTSENLSPEMLEGGANNLGKIFGILLHGPAGTGKTYTMQVLAKTLNADVVNLNSKDLKSMFQGVTEKVIGGIFDEIIVRAKTNKNKQIIVCLDELEGIFRRADLGHSTEHGASARQAILTELNRLIEQNKETHNITVVGTTNYFDHLDQALVDRLTTHIEVGFPDVESFKEIIKLKVENKKFLNLNKKIVTNLPNDFYDKLAAELCNKKASIRDLENIILSVNADLHQNAYKGDPQKFIDRMNTLTKQYVVKKPKAIDEK